MKKPLGGVLSPCLLVSWMQEKILVPVAPALGSWRPKKHFFLEKTKWFLHGFFGVTGQDRTDREFGRLLLFQALKPTSHANSTLLLSLPFRVKGRSSEE